MSITDKWFTEFSRPKLSYIHRQMSLSPLILICSKWYIRTDRIKVVRCLNHILKREYHLPKMKLVNMHIIVCKRKGCSKKIWTFLEWIFSISILFKVYEDIANTLTIERTNYIPNPKYKVLCTTSSDRDIPRPPIV